jgi:peptidyl-prolyl cis-trans isomerase B (cyclophilin B)
MAPKYKRKKQAQTKSNSKGNAMLIYIIIGIIAIVAIIAGAYFIGGFGSNTGTGTPTTTPNPTPATENTKVLLKTNKGDITIQLFDNKPTTTQNFLKLVALGKYDNTIFHRVLKSFMIQGGALTKNAQYVDPNWPTIKDEIGTENHNYKYTIAMAKTEDPNSASTSFFINTVDNSELVYSDGRRFDDIYTAFGIVIKGQDVVDAIANVSVTTNGGGENSQPTQTITINSAKIIS